MKKKYEITNTIVLHDGKKLHRIRALRDFGQVKSGTLGGFIEHEDNLSHEGNCWVADRARVWGNAVVRENAWVCGDAKVLDNAVVSGHANIGGRAKVFGKALVNGDTFVRGSATVGGQSHVSGTTILE